MTLLDDFRLLAFSPVSDSRPPTPVIAEAAYGAAELIELQHAGRVDFESGRVRVNNPQPTGDAVLDEGLARLQRVKPTRPLYTLRRIGRLSLRSADSRPPTGGETRRTELVRQVTAVVDDGGTPPSELLPLLGLLYVTNSFGHVLGKADAAGGRRRGKQILAADWTDQNAQYVIREAYASMTFTGILRSAPRFWLNRALRGAIGGVAG